ncbi:AMP-binding protein [uncultured Tateyamaria sp.]|uniref:AMP-binding protein n=1 Tax=uncultured Tateyamaria sp. TaxID=455651 RepID=UPI00260F4F4B|nr:AMP-binding protein [uncultured Tateyamaria sp.]
MLQGDDSRRALLDAMRAVVAANAERIAVREHDGDVTYEAFGQLIATAYAAIEAAAPTTDTPIGILLDRSANAYAAIWAAIAHGRPYVPLNTRYPVSRLRDIVRNAGIDAIVCTKATQPHGDKLGGVLALMDQEDTPPAQTGFDWGQGKTAGKTAYILFTSGSTGAPKGVPVSYSNLASFVTNMNAVIPYRPDDICSQVCELSFDFSVHEIYLALLNGCTLCPARQIDLFNPAHYIASRAITVWISVPSLARVILNNGLSAKTPLGTVRLSIFNGEALTAPLAQEWSKAASNATIWNTYGPTECTVAVTALCWQDDPALVSADVVAIGTPLPNCATALLHGDVISPTGTAPDDTRGELLLSGPQLFDGYLDPNLAEPFVTDTAGTRHYRTGDNAMWRDGRLYHLGRVDHQVKIGGHRIELLEIEHRVRANLGSEAVAVIAHPDIQPTELVLFYSGAQEPPTLTAEALGLPGYMIPKRAIELEAMPTSAHGKLDRAALRALADQPR